MSVCTFRRVAIAAVLAQLVSLALFYALFAPSPPAGASEEAIAAEFRASGLWLLPTTGFVASAIAAMWVAWRSSSGSRDGFALGAAVALLDVALLAGAGTQWLAIFAASPLARLIGGGFGGYFVSSWKKKS